MDNRRIVFICNNRDQAKLKLCQKICRSGCSLGLDVGFFCLPSALLCGKNGCDDMILLGEEKVRHVRNNKQLFRNSVRGADILIDFGGPSIHPEWLKGLNLFSVYIGCDEFGTPLRPSKSLAPFYDYVFTSNAGLVPLYQGWGIKRCGYLPMAWIAGDSNSSLCEKKVFDGERKTDVVLPNVFDQPQCSLRLDVLQKAFPSAIIPEQEQSEIYSKAKIGINIHNSVGPGNLRTFALPANGVMQICDNKCRLGSLFELNHEVVGFDTIKECIDAVRYYLAHDQERQEIAAKGFERVMRDYTDDMQWERIFTAIAPYYEQKKRGELNTPVWKYDSGSAIEFIKGKSKRGMKRLFTAGGLQISRLAPIPAFEKSSPAIQKGFPGELAAVDSPPAPYHENKEVGAVNWKEKMERVAQGGFFEWPNMVALNWVVASLVGSNKRILELGCGTGCFAYEAASDPTNTIFATELDCNAIEWAIENRSRPNIRYLNRFPEEADGRFDVVVSVDVIEHISDVNSFLRTCTKFADKAILTTPNRLRNAESASVLTPKYSQHIREWSAGEFYWMLRVFYQRATLYGMQNPFVPIAYPMNINDVLTPIIAVCEDKI